MLNTEDHRRDSAGMTYIYPVVSRRAGGVSIGVNLNINNACNWACAYCQVDGLSRGGPPPIDLGQLHEELERMLDDIFVGDFMCRAVPPEARRLMDVAFSGNGEPTSAGQFSEAVSVVRDALARRDLLGSVRIRLITNGSLLHRPAVRRGIGEIGAAGGEVWFKLDRIGEAETKVVNGVPINPVTAARNLERCIALAPTWIQTCWFAMDGSVPNGDQQQKYCQFLQPFADRLCGIHLYGLARPSMQPGAPRLQRLGSDRLEQFAQLVREQTGIKVLVNP